MKKLFLLTMILIAIAMCLPATVRAMSINGIDTVGQGNWGIGGILDIVSGRDEEYTGGIKTYEGETLEMDSDVDVNRQMVKLVYGLFDGWDIYGMFGTSKFNANINWTDTVSGEDYYGNPYSESFTGNFEMNGDSGTVYGLGIKGKTETESGWIFGGDAQYLKQKNDYSGKFKVTDEFYPYEERISGDADFSEWHIALLAGKRMGSLVPYGGIKYSNVKTIINLNWNEYPEDDSETCNFGSKKNVGAVIGTDWNINDSWNLNLEGRFIDETAISIAANWKF